MSNLGPYVQSMQDQERDAARYRFLREHYETNLIVMAFGNGCINKTMEMAETQFDAERATAGVEEVDRGK